MTYTSKGSAAPPGQGAPTALAVPPQAARPAPPAASGPPEAGPPRRTAFMEGVDELRASATTEPGRLRIIGAALALLVVAFGAVTAWQMSDRSAAADDVLHSSQPLSAAAADVYRALADANTAASSGFLAGGQETPASRTRYEKDIRDAADGLAGAATASDPGSSSARTIAELNKLLPEYKGLVERARANNRQGYPLGGAYLRYANQKMQEEMLPRAERLYKNENRRLSDDYDSAVVYPWAAIGLGVLTLGTLVWAQRRNYHRTNRVLNRGLVAASAASTVVLLWLVVGHAVARSELLASYNDGVVSVNVLNDARIASLKARGNENLTLVSRGAETTESGDDKFDSDFKGDMKELSTSLAKAEDIADDSSGERPVKAATGNMKVWLERHQEAREADNDGDYQAALSKVIGSEDDKPTWECFDSVVKNLEKALGHEQNEFKLAASSGRDALSGLPVGAALLAVLGASGAVLGIGRRLSEYR
ncbi:hypothetical protein [Streptomyces spongiae]|uniref:Secreted protein n=1 Tax=Streptomyces spongiae TaxID=565072 RepID=A0A5N8XN50_9ACTN|nr:hypothetical protein [Streptomyces spongiae]MPY59975.1 hypothetical protein [Streptomyces spongiae]